MNVNEAPADVWVLWSENGIEKYTTDRDMAGEYARRSREIHCTHFRASAERDALAAENRKLKDILAIIHKDGGHRTEEVGVSQAIEEAHRIWGKLIAENEAQAEEIERLNRALEKEGDRYDAEVNSKFFGLRMKEAEELKAQLAAAQAELEYERGSKEELLEGLQGAYAKLTRLQSHGVNAKLRQRAEKLELAAKQWEWQNAEREKLCEKAEGRVRDLEQALTRIVNLHCHYIESGGFDFCGECYELAKIAEDALTPNESQRRTVTHVGYARGEFVFNNESQEEDDE